MSFKENGNLYGEIKNVRLLKEVSHSRHTRMFVCFRVCLIHIVANQSVFSQASLRFTVMKAYLIMVVVVAPCLCAVCTRPSSPEERDKDRAS